MLHQVSGRGALRLARGHHPLLLRCGSVLRLWPRGADRHPNYGGEPLLQGHQRPRHLRHGVSLEWGFNIIQYIVFPVTILVTRQYKDPHSLKLVHQWQTSTNDESVLSSAFIYCYAYY